MLAIEPLRGSNGGEESFSSLDEFCQDGFLGEISFSDLFMGVDEDGDMLPDLELDPADIFAEFSVNGGGVVEEEEEDEDEEDSGSASTERGTVGDVTSSRDMAAMEYPMEAENEVRRGEQAGSAAASTPYEPRADSVPDEGEKARKTAAVTTTAMAAKGMHGKRKAKVDWTPELHRRFVQAVEQLGIDKAVPSRILELMGIDCLTRHNIASHLQKYRSHRKHLLARGAEAASWSQRRQTYAGSAVVAAKRPAGHGWPAAYPAIGYLPPLPSPPAVPPLRPLHVWGHPPVVDAPRLTTWPRRPPWAANPHPDPSFWQHQCYYYHRGSGEAPWVPHAITKGAPCFPPAAPLPTTVSNAFTGRFPGAPVPGIVPVSHPIYGPVLPNAMAKNSSAQPLVDAHPSKESVDAAIEDVLEKPWLPMPLGLKPPSLDSVLLELHKNGVSKVP